MFSIEEKMEIMVWLKQDSFLRHTFLYAFFMVIFMKEFLKVENLCFGYLKKPLCLKDINFSAQKNDRILVLGIDNSGKTSLLKTLSGFDSHFFGKVFYEGKEIREILDEEKNVSLIFDEPILLNSTIDKNINFVYETLKQQIPSTEKKQEFLKNFNIQHDLKCKIKKLSNFGKFKLCFLRTFIKNSKIVFVDDILKHKFSEFEVNELKEILDKYFKDKLLFFVSNNENFLRFRAFFDWFEPVKILYLNNSRVFKYKSICEFFDCVADLDVCSFFEGFKTIEGFCVFQEGSYFLSFNDEFVIKIDKELNSYFEKLKLAANENEDIVLVYKNGVNIDLSKNNDINKMLSKKEIMIFSKLDRSRVL